MREIQQAPELESAIRQVLDAARTMLAADLAQIILLPREETASVIRGTLRRDGDLSLEPIELDAAAALALDTVSAQQHAILLPRGRDPHVLDPYLAECSVPDGVVASVQREQGTPGLILVGERSGDIGTFTEDDAKLLETFANHTAVVLESDQVREQLRHQAFHDQLTGLPNRFLFAERVAEALREPPAERARVAVLFLDLDDFKTINDSLGHSAGDELLVAVAARIQACAVPGAVAARLGGDEFAVLLPAATRDEARAYATRLLGAFNGFFNLHAREGGAASQRRRRDVQREGQRQAQPHVLRSGDAPAREATARARVDARARSRARRDRSALPADRRPPHRQRLRVRSARTLAAP
jgi:diguanylate cyclase (GGDEF)-like protein